MLRIGSALIVFFALGCGGDDGGTGQPDDNFDRRAMLANLGDNLLIPVYDGFQAAAGGLETAVSAYCAALGTGEEATRLSEAQTAWNLAMDAWQLAESMLFGPAAMNEKTLREQVYSWPAISSCAVDQEVATYHDAGSADIATKLNNRRGLDAVEYLLFAADLEHTCPVQSAPAGWDALSDDQRKAARCGYAGLAAADVRVRADIVAEAWSPTGGNFIGDLKSAGESDSSFASAQEAVNVVSDALFYLDTEVKTMKLGEPAGITLNSCNTVMEPCLAELESQFGLHSRENVVANLRGASMLFHGDSLAGDPGLGFDDFLIELGASDLAATMSADFAAAISSAEAIPTPLRDALSGDYASVQAAHQATRAITVNLKSQFLTVLGLDLPDSAAGDND
ncbi:MAG: imelysin family protein [Deltaproteobacteria bacterium]|nr:imelysin family protein [Deltaproteobacteria bacterium]